MSHVAAAVPEREITARAAAGGIVAEASGQPMRAFASGEALSRGALLAAPVRWPRPSRLAAALPLPAGRSADALASLGVDSVGALLEHLPSDSREARTVGGLRGGEAATVDVEVRTIAARPVRRRGMKPLVEASVFDETGTMKATFFNQPWLAQRYRPGTRLVLHGRLTPKGTFAVSHHATGTELGAAAASDAGAAGGAGAGGAGGEGGAVAHYPATEGVSSTQILALVGSLRGALGDVPEALPAAIRVGEGLARRAEALGALHFPEGRGEGEAARERLAFEELLLTQLAFLARRERRRAGRRAPALAAPGTLSERWLTQELAFELTGDQRAAIATLAGDLACEQPMQRLLLGEVGSGKTVVAAYGLLRAVEHGMQAALMAPTETLAEQHFATLQQLLGGGLAEVRCGLLTGSTPAGRRAEILGRLASGELALIVGTHALIEPDVRFAELAVAVVDEQHRFGVRQRAALDGQAMAADATRRAPHVLHMTATPIPRTLALARYGDLDTTLLRELPRGRQPIATRVIAGEEARARAYEELRAQLRAGRQAYVVCPQIEQTQEPGEPGEQGGRGSAPGGAGQASETKAAVAEFQRLAGGELKDHRLVLMHGGMRPREKAQAMAQFASGAKDVLVATTVIEVGIDVANATVMLIENAERFGISQLHQLRGRVGRGEHSSLCLLMGPPNAARLRALAEHTDGFALAEIDLRLRKEGELIGTRQSGLGQFRVARLPQDGELLARARARAEEIAGADPGLAAPEHALLAEALREAFGEESSQPIPG
ncbi:MAG TPA: ATP-dependent DNA helicase RecG [Solirubrobacteraceae bacterium]|nr:ATP-dependent DNA helicase RecG [Solirubrobacteraceae bacterium]